MLAVSGVCAAEPGANQAPNVAVQASDWNGYQKQSFVMDGIPCFVVVPKTSAPGKPWVWRTSFPDYHPEVDIELLKQGCHIAYIDVVGMLGSDPALELMDKFYLLVLKQWGLSKKAAMEGVSRGGLHAYRYAARHPDRVACIYADVPVMTIASWPLKRADAKGELAEALKYYGFKSEDELKAYRGNPIDILEPIAKAKIPLRHVISLNDKVVPPEENTLEAQRRLEKLNWSIEIVSVKEGNACDGHQFPLPEVPETARFIMKHVH